MKKLLEFLDKLESHKIYYKLNKVKESILVEIAVPGERWEVEFFEDDKIAIERFHSTGHIDDEKQIEDLFNRFCD